jgi:hypothetical protein
MLRTSDPATQKINDWFRSNSPFEKAKTTTVAIEVNNIVALSNQSYQIDWTEFERDRKGKETGERRFRGIATVTLTPPQDEQTIRLNPIGLYERAGDADAAILDRTSYRRSSCGLRSWLARRRCQCKRAGDERQGAKRHEHFESMARVDRPRDPWA